MGASRARRRVQDHGRQVIRPGVYYFTPPNRHGRWVWLGELGPGMSWETDDEAERYFQARGYATMRVTPAASGEEAMSAQG